MRTDYMGNITNDKIKKYIDEYLSEGYGDRVKTRCWDNMYIHMPQTKRFIDGVPTCSLWKRVVFEKKKEFLAIKDFDKLYEQLKLLKRTNKIEGIGDLIIYDTATCLGCPNNVFPSSIYIFTPASLKVWWHYLTSNVLGANLTQRNLLINILHLIL